ncbi:MAG: hypothetical protein IT379_09670 [Deltaproteobacteria bacterium]|nr:hypothetical protein [Deltaproteobacteria bacterium]
MTRASVSGSWVAAALACAASACSGSAGQPPDLEITHNQAPAAGTCELSQSATRNHIDDGTFDLALGDRSSYTLTPLVENRGADDVVFNTVRLESYHDQDGVFVRLNFVCDNPTGCETWDIDLCEGGTCPTVAAGESGSFEVPVLPRLVTGYFQTIMDGAVREGRIPPEFRLQSVARLIGTASDGSTEVESEPFSFVVNLCLGCLVAFPEGSDSPAIPGEDCCGGGAPADQGCYPGQDAPIDCRSCVRTLPEICNYGRVTCDP